MLINFDFMFKDPKAGLLISAFDTDQVAGRVDDVLKVGNVIVIAVVGQIRDEDSKLKRIDQALKCVRDWQ